MHVLAGTQPFASEPSAMSPFCCLDYLWRPNANSEGVPAAACASLELDKNCVFSARITDSVDRVTEDFEERENERIRILVRNLRQSTPDNRIRFTKTSILQH
jgi:hypothetical protein